VQPFFRQPPFFDRILYVTEITEIIPFLFEVYVRVPFAASLVEIHTGAAGGIVYLCFLELTRLLIEV